MLCICNYVCICNPPPNPTFISTYNLIDDNDDDDKLPYDMIISLPRSVFIISYYNNYILLYFQKI